MWASILLASRVLYATPDAVYVDEGREQGVTVGDTVVITGQRLAIVDVTARSCRTAPPKDAFAIKPGDRARVERQREAAPEQPAAPDKPRPPAITPESAKALWASAPNGWAEVRPRPQPAGAQAKTDEPRAVRLSGRLALTGLGVTSEDGETLFESRLNSRLRATGERWQLDSDLGVAWDDRAERYPRPPLEIRRLEGRFEGEGYQLRGGRFSPTPILGSGLLDGGRVDWGGLWLSGGIAPSPDELHPTTDMPEAALGYALPFTLLDAKATLRGVGLLTAYQGSADRTAAGLSFDWAGSVGSLAGQVEVDLAGARSPEGRGAADVSRAWLSGRVRWNDWLDSAFRADRLHLWPTLRDTLSGFPLTGDARHGAYLDTRLRFASGAQLTPAFSVLSGDEGETYVPSARLFVPLTEAFDLEGDWLYRDGPDLALHGGGFNIAWRELADGGLFAAVGGRLTRLTSAALTEWEETGEARLGVSLPQDLELALFGEYTHAELSRATALAELRWRFRD